MLIKAQQSKQVNPRKTAVHRLLNMNIEAEYKRLLFEMDHFNIEETPPKAILKEMNSDVIHFPFPEEMQDPETIKRNISRRAVRNREKKNSIIFYNLLPQIFLILLMKL